MIRALPCLMYFLTLCISLDKVDGGFLLRDLKNSTNVFPFYIAYMARDSSKSKIYKASALNLATYFLSVSSLLCLTISKYWSFPKPVHQQ